MENVEITSVSSRGQVVIPQSLREKLGIHAGQKFIVIGEDNMIVLRKLELPSFEGFEKLLNKTREFAGKKKIKESDVESATKQIRKR